MVESCRQEWGPSTPQHVYTIYTSEPLPKMGAAAIYTVSQALKKGEIDIRRLTTIMEAYPTLDWEWASERIEQQSAVRSEVDVDLCSQSALP